MVFLKDTPIIVSELHHCKFLMTNKSLEDISYVLVDTNQRLLSNLMRGNCPLLENVLFPTHLQSNRCFGSKQCFSLKENNKNNQPAQPKVFSPKYVPSRDQQFQVIPVSPLSSLENYFEVGSYDIDSSFSSSQTSKLLEAVKEAEINMNLSTSIAANGASFLPYTPAVQFTPNFTGCNTVNFHFHYHQH